ncbi:MAG: tRNA-dihydrouridine synthase family protein [Treponema sp.]|jgi:tRNA-dihydrouridine synthase|nr:tRNA-dihydrouridine synthase family protein [Treponema sp.]
MPQNSLMFAPMAELSHRALRELIVSFTEGSATRTGSLPVEFFTEMISAAGLVSGGPFEKWYLDPGPRPGLLVYQLLGSDIETIRAAAELLETTACLGVDLNMGCAAPLIKKSGGGIRWMEDGKKAALLVGAVRRVCSKRLSVKIRLGPEKTLYDEEAVFARLEAFCRRLVDAGADLITLHPRMAGEKFKRRARWEYVTRLRQALSVPVAGNGDISSINELLERLREGPVMIGRLAVQKPWIFAQAAGARIDEASVLEETALRFLDLLRRFQPPEFHPSRARRFFRYYCDNFTWAEQLRNRINREPALSGIAAVIRGYVADGLAP